MLPDRGEVGLELGFELRNGPDVEPSKALAECDDERLMELAPFAWDPWLLLEPGRDQGEARGRVGDAGAGVGLDRPVAKASCDSV